MLRREIETKIASIRIKLDELHQYKRILNEEGLVPDQADKLRESKLIQQILGFQKDLARMDAKKQLSAKIRGMADKREQKPQNQVAKIATKSRGPKSNINARRNSRG